MMINDTHFYYTKFPILETTLESAMEDWVKKNSETGLISRLFGPSQEEKTLECTRATNTIAILRFLKNRLRTNETEPVTEADKSLLILARALVAYPKKDLVNIILPKIIELSKDTSGRTSGFFIDPSFGNKAFQDHPRHYKSYILSQQLRSYSERETVVLSCLDDDLSKCKINGKVDQKALDVLLNTSWLKTPITLACIWTHHNSSMHGIPRDVLKLIVRHVNYNLIEDLHQRIRQVII